MSSNPRPQPQSDDPMEEGQVVTAPNIGTLAVLNSSEIDQQIATAKRFPRSISHFRKEALQLATLDEQTARECIYALPRDGKTIEGPSARFAEIMNYAWGNTRAGARVVSEDGDFITAQGLFYDLEKNTAISYEVNRRIVDKNGKRFKVDMIGMTGNAASSIALRNAILKGIPKAIWRAIYVEARKVVAGDVRTLANRRDEALKAFAIFGITPAQIYAKLGVGGLADISIDHMVALFGVLTAIQEGDTTPEQAFAPESSADARAAAGTQQTGEELRNKYANKQPANSSEGSSQPAASVQAQVTTQDPSQAPEMEAKPSPNPPQESPAPVPSSEAAPTEEPKPAFDATAAADQVLKNQQAAAGRGRDRRQTSGVPLDFAKGK